MIRPPKGEVSSFVAGRSKTPLARCLGYHALRSACGVLPTPRMQRRYQIMGKVDQKTDSPSIRRGVDRVVRELGRILRQSQDELTRVRVIRALGALGPASAPLVPALIELAGPKPGALSDCAVEASAISVALAECSDARNGPRLRPAWCPAANERDWRCKVESGRPSCR